ncbi:hypothetical protein J6590_046671 [Homalodisca vitripennis]|nr:hypothetical protein J6590_046671 [Homalodisca vitripennis]
MLIKFLTVNIEAGGLLRTAESSHTGYTLPAGRGSPPRTPQRLSVVISMIIKQWEKLITCRLEDWVSRQRPHARHASSVESPTFYSFTGNVYKPFNPKNGETIQHGDRDWPAKQWNGSSNLHPSNMALGEYQYPPGSGGDVEGIKPDIGKDVMRSMQKEIDDREKIEIRILASVRVSEHLLVLLSGCKEKAFLTTFSDGYQSY